MNKTFRSTLDSLMTINRAQGIKMGLDNIRNVASAMRIEHCPYVHIAGTNGKGSVAHKLSEFLRPFGCKIGMFTSPHISTFRERIRINNELIPLVDVERITNKITDASKETDTTLTFFETLTLLSMVYFREQRADLVLLEAGLGGRTDSTNIIPPPLAAVITSISKDHVEYLGDSLEEIAGHKAGIIKPSTSVIASESIVPIHVFEEACENSQSTMHVVPLEPGSTPNQYASNLENSKVALQTLKVLARSPALQRESPTLFDALQGAMPDALDAENLKKLISFNAPCRFQILDPTCLKPEFRTSGTSVCLDVGHNPAGLASLAEAICEYTKDTGNGPMNVHMVVAMSSGKDIRSNMETFTKSLHRPIEQVRLCDVVFTRGRNDERARSPEELLTHSEHVLLENGVASVSSAPCVATALERAVTNSKAQAARSLIVVCGSFFVMDDAKRAVMLPESWGEVVRDEYDMNERGMRTN